MSDESKVTLSAVVPMEIKERFKRIAKRKRWSVSQTLTIFIEEFLDNWEEEIEPESSNGKKKQL